MLVCAFLCASMHTRPRVQRAPGLPCALLFLGAECNCKNSDKTMSRERKGVFVFVARMSGATCGNASPGYRSAHPGYKLPHTPSHSRDTLRPSYLKAFAPKKQRAQGMPGARCTRGLVCKRCTKKAHTSIQVQRRQSGLPCAMALRLISCSPRRPGFFVTVAPKKR